MYSREFLDGFSLGATVCDDTNGSRSLHTLYRPLRDSATAHMKHLADFERPARHAHMKRVAAQLRAPSNPNVQATGRFAIIYDRVMAASSSSGTPIPNVRRGFSFSPALRFALHRLVRECSRMHDGALALRVNGEMDFVQRLHESKT